MNRKFIMKPALSSLLIFATVASVSTQAATYSGVTSNTFNPAISLILDGRFTRFSENPETYGLAGFALAEETGPGEEGFSLGESELTITANIDDRYFGSFTLALSPENEAELEEAFIESLSLGLGFRIRAGRFYSSIGYLNEFHAHAWDFVDQPLPYRAMLGNQYADDGVQIRWLAPSNIFLALGVEAFRGESFPAGGAADDGMGSYAGFMHIGTDVGSSHSWRLGLSYLEAESNARETGDETGPDIFTGKSQLGIVDFVWKWAPNGNPSQRNFKLQAEYFYRDEQDTDNVFNALSYEGSQSGWYAQGVYQFIPRWRLGIRYDTVQADDVAATLDDSVLDNQDHAPERTSIMLDYSRSEFSRLRLQYNRDKSRPDDSDNQYYLQYIMSLGAHGAHKY